MELVSKWLLNILSEHLTLSEAHFEVPNGRRPKREQLENLSELSHIHDCC